MLLTSEDERRFWKNVRKGDGPDACWLWTGILSEGYGNFVTRARVHSRSHRVSWVMHRGPIPKGLCVLHNCPTGDDRKCVNPDHLWLGTHADNAKDCAKKGRNCKGDQHWSRKHPERLPRGDRNGARRHIENVQRGDGHWTHREPEKCAYGDRNGSRKHPERLPHGENHHSSKLSDKERKVIVPQLYRQGWTQRRIAERFGVKQSSVGRILQRLRAKGVLC